MRFSARKVLSAGAVFFILVVYIATRFSTAVDGEGYSHSHVDVRRRGESPGHLAGTLIANAAIPFHQSTTTRTTSTNTTISTTSSKELLPLHRKPNYPLDPSAMLAHARAINAEQIIHNSNRFSLVYSYIYIVLSLTGPFNICPSVGICDLHFQF